MVGAGASREIVEHRRGRAALFVIGALGLVLLSACTTDQGRSGEDRRLAGRGLSRGEEATIGAYLQQADDLQTRIAVATTALPTSERGNLPVPFAQAWNVGVRSVDRLTSLPNYSTKSGDPLTIEPHGEFLVVRLAVAAASSRAGGTFPWWDLRLQDGGGRTFTPQSAATASFAMTDPGVRDARASGARRSGAVHDEGVVFDVPPNLSHLTLRSDDNTFSLDISPDATVASAAIARPHRE